MGMMTRMRNLAPWFIVTVGAVFVLFMVLSDANVSEIFRNQSRIIGEINGKEIYYQDFVNRVEFEKTNLEKQGRVIEETQMSDFRDQVWDAMVNEALIEKKIEEFGIEVTDQEVIDLILGANPPQFVKQYFTDSTGAFNRQAYDAAMRNPENKEAVLQIEEMVKRQLTQQKLTDHLFAAVQVSEDELMEDFAKQHIYMNADYVAVMTSSISDKDVKLTDEYQKEYYKKNILNYNQEEKRVIDYVLFSLQPSKEDTSTILNNLSSIIEKSKNDTLPFKNYIEIYSEKPYSVDTLSLTKIDVTLQKALSNAKDGEIIGPAITREGVILAKLIAKTDSKEPSVRASHILVKLGTDEKAALQKANDIYTKVTSGGNFAQIANEVSEDPGSAVKGGDLGWFSKGQMVPEFEQAVFNGQIGQIQKPVKTNFGYHIILVTEKSSTDYVVERIINELKPTATTIDNIYQKASDFSYLAKENNFKSEAELMKLKSIESKPFTKTQKSISGLGSNFSITSYSFNNSIGEVSDVFRVQNGYVVFQVLKEIEEGPQPYEEVKEVVHSQALNELKLEKAMEITKKIKAKIGSTGNLELAKQVFPAAKVAQVNNFKIGVNIPTIGREFAFSEYAYTAKVGKVSQPIKGNRASFLVKLTSRTPFDQTGYSVQRLSIYEKLLRAKQREFLTDWMEKVKEEAEVKDYRYNFFR